MSGVGRHVAVDVSGRQRASPPPRAATAACNLRLRSQWARAAPRRARSAQLSAQHGPRRCHCVQLAACCY